MMRDSREKREGMRDQDPPSRPCEFIRNCVGHVLLRTVSVIQMTSPNSLKILFSPSFFANFKGSRNYDTASNQIRTTLMKHGSKEAAFSITLTTDVPH